MSIAFNRPEPAVDGNVMRVLSRFFCLEEDIAKPSTRVGIEKLAASLIPEGAAGDFNQALMELGALVCSPKSPSCLPCPVMEHCGARLAGKETELPIKTKAKKPRNELRIAAIVRGNGENAGKILVRQRPSTGLLAQMWELPHILLPKEQELLLSTDGSKLEDQQEAGELLTRAVEEDTGLLIRPYRWFMDADHIFSHIHWKMRIYEADLGQAYLHSELAAESAAAYELGEDLAEAVASGGEHYRFIGPEDMETLAFPNLFIRILRHYWE